jgi:hypothetical protein
MHPTNIHGPSPDLFIDYTDPYSAAGDPVIGQARAWERGDVGMRAIDGTHTATGLDYTVDGWQRHYFVPVTTAEKHNFKDVAVFTGPCAQGGEGRAVRQGRVVVKCNLGSATVTADMAFKVTNGQVYLSPADAASSGAARIVARATRNQVLPGTGVQLVEVIFDGIGPGYGVRFT